MSSSILSRSSPHLPSLSPTQLDLQPGQMAVFDDAPVRHRVTPIQVSEGNTAGHRDVVLMSYGGQLTV